MKTFSSFIGQIDEIKGVAPKAKGEHKFVHSTYLNQIKDPGDLEKVGPEEIGPHDTKAGSGKRPADRLDNKQKFGESVDLEENYRALAQKGIGAERKQDIKVGHGVDYYHPKDGSKHMGKIHHMDDKGYTVKDDKTGEKHKFDYFRKEEVEHVEDYEQIDELSKDTLTRYANTAASSARHNMAKTSGAKSPEEASKAGQTATKRLVGYHKALKKIGQKNEEVEHVEEGRGAYDELTRRMGTSSPGFNKTPAGKAREQKRRQEHLKGQMKFTQRMGGLTGPKSKLPEEVELDEEGYHVMGRTTSVSWHKTKEEAQKQADKLNMRGGTHHTVKSAERTDGGKKPKNEEVGLDEADFSKAQTKMAHAIGKHFKSKGIGDESKGGPFAVASAMVRDKPDAAKKAYATIKAKMKNEDQQDMLMALYDSLSEDNRNLFDQMIEVDQEKLLEFAKTALSNYEGE